MGAAGRIVDWDDVDILATALHDSRLRIIFTNGCFDLLHVGHVRLLQGARALGNVLVVGLNSDSSVRQLKGPDRPVVAHSERAEILAALACVDYVVVFDDLTPVELIRRIRPHVHVKGGEYSPGLGKSMPEAEALAELGTSIHFLPMMDGKSTSRVIQCVQALPAIKTL